MQGLVEQIRQLRADPKRRTSMSKYGEAPPLYPPVTALAIALAEIRLGFRLPPFLCELYQQVGNGGFGPGYGIWGLDGGHPTGPPIAPPDADNIVDAFLDCKEAAGGGPWSPEIVICSWGCCNGSAIDCSMPEGE